MAENETRKSEIELERLRLLAMKQVATKLQFQLKKEDRQALVDRTNQEITE